MTMRKGSVARTRGVCSGSKSTSLSGCHAVIAFSSERPIRAASSSLGTFKEGQVVVPPGERIEFLHLGTVIRDAADARFGWRHIAERTCSGNQVDQRRQHEVVMQDDVIGDAQSRAEIVHPRHHLQQTIDEVVCHEPRHPALADRIDQQVAAGREIERSIVDDRERRRFQDRSGTDDITPRALDIPLLEIEEMATTAAATLMEFQHGHGALSPRRKVGPGLHFVAWRFLRVRLLQMMEQRIHSRRPRQVLPPVERMLNPGATRDASASQQADRKSVV